eukprot:GHVS01064706.1.p1 GENE.GHVS01064706.1~~GHVS01064706.1.p1  ORF type:complete len:252 (+),score=89.09 GHVS01064706.1:516-1271(+)
MEEEEEDVIAGIGAMNIDTSNANTTTNNATTSNATTTTTSNGTTSNATTTTTSNATTSTTTSTTSNASTTTTTSSVTSYSRHCIHPQPEKSACFRSLLSYLRTYFDLDIYAHRLNFYASIDDWKPFHHDSHAYSAQTKQKEDFTVGVSFGAERALSFLHVQSEVQFDIPQCNGDLFAFNGNVNKVFKHGVPKGKQSRQEKIAAEMSRRSGGGSGGGSGGVGRISVIAWGRRQKLTSRNAGVTELRKKDDSF